MTTTTEDSKEGVLAQVQPGPASPTQQPSATSPGATATTPATNSEGRTITCEDIQLVQNLIERCLQLYMNQVEVIKTLKYQAKIEPGFTSLVWQKLEEQNPDFFRAYYIRLKVKKQILLFNHLLAQHVQLLQKMSVYPVPVGIVPTMQNMHHMPMGYAMAAGPATGIIPHMVGMAIPVSNPNIGSGENPVQEYAPQHGSPGSTPIFPFSHIGNPTDITGMQMGLTTSMALDTPFISNDPVQSTIGPLSMATTEGDSTSTRESLGSLGQLPRNFSLSDLTAELTNGSDLGALGSYTGSPFLTPDTGGYLQSPEKELPGLGDEEPMVREDIQPNLLDLK